MIGAAPDVETGCLGRGTVLEPRTYTSKDFPPFKDIILWIGKRSDLAVTSISGNGSNEDKSCVLFKYPFFGGHRSNVYGTFRLRFSCSDQVYKV